MNITQEEYNAIAFKVRDLDLELKRQKELVEMYHNSSMQSNDRWNDLFENDLKKAFDTRIKHDEFRHEIQMILVDYDYCITCGKFGCECE